MLIDANRDYYPIGRVDEYWAWLVFHGQEGNVKTPIDIYEEIKEGKDLLAAWSKEAATEAALKFDEEVDIDLVRKITDEGYAEDLTDIELEKVGRDPLLIAYALFDPANRCVVTTERSKPKAERANRHVPDVCDQFGITRMDGFEFARQLDFRTNWKRP